MHFNDGDDDDDDDDDDDSFEGTLQRTSVTLTTWKLCFQK